jgi:ubiquinone biosynthesis monooxygenase Coq7
MPARRVQPLLEAHIEQEKEHLATFDTLLPWRYRSRLLPFWRLAGALTGVVAGLTGRRGMIATIAAVERFVDRHYLEQIEQLEALIDPAHTASPACATGVCGPASRADRAELLRLLKAFRDDECRHRDEALQALDEGAPGDTGRALKVWCDLVERGSAIAVKAARAI